MSRAAGEPGDGGASIERRVFLVGCPRSGTTLLQALLAAHPRIASFPESHFFPSLLLEGPGRGVCRERLSAFVQALGLHDLRRRLAEEGWAIRPSIAAFVGALDVLALARGRGIWVEKTPGHLHFIETIAEHVDRAAFVHIVRSGLEVVASLYEVTRTYPELWGGPWDLDRCIAQWIEDVAVTRRYEQTPGHLVIAYEDLVERPEVVLGGLCVWLGVDFRRDMLAQGPDVARGLVLADEPWKAQATGPIRSTGDGKPERLFDAGQRAYILRRLADAGAAGRRGP